MSCLINKGSAKSIISTNRIATTAKGWTDNNTCLEWFRKTFIPQATARRENPEETIILVMDGHESHKTPEMQRLALEHNIEFFFLPPHTTHRLQPLDVGVFGPLQRRWQQRCDEIISETNGEVPRSQFVKEYMGVRNEVFTKELIQSAWKKAGMWPPNSHKFTEEDFAPSKLMSYNASLPAEFPEVPDILVFSHGREGDEEIGNRVGRDDNRPVDGVTDEEVTDSDDNEVDDSGNEAGNTDDGVGDGGDDTMDEGEAGSERDGEVTENGADAWEDDRRVGEGEMNIKNGRGKGVDTGEAPEDEVVGGINSPRNKNHLSRCERKTHHLEQLMLTYPRSSCPGASLTFTCNCDRARIKELEEEVRSLRSQLETALAHSACARWEIKSLQERLNSKSARTNKRKVQVNAHYISSAEASQMLDEQERADAEKRQKEEEAQAAKKAKDDQRKQQRETRGITFAGSLNNKTRDDLLDISFALGLTGSDSNTPETKATLITMINAHLDDNIHLTSDPTFAGLFLSRNRGRKRTTNNEDVTPTSLPLPVPLPPRLPRQSLSGDNIPEPESDPPPVLFNELPAAGRFFRPIDPIPANPSFVGPFSFPQYPYHPPLIPHATDPHLPPFHHSPTSPYSYRYC